MSAADGASAGAQAERRLLRALFPFHFTVGADGRLAAVGERWRTLAPSVAVGARFDDVFAVQRPAGLAGHGELAQHCDDIFLLATRERPDCVLRGQFVAADAAPGALHFAGGPWGTKLAALVEQGLTLADFPPHDPRGDLLVLLQVQEAQLAELKQLTGRLQERIRRQAQLEGQLRQIQKMELVGRLAGGLAHNFNNILMAIRSHADLALEDLPADSPVREWLEHIGAATDHAASLTRGLLTMSRQQPLRIQAVDVAAEFAEIRKLVAPLLGERVRLAIAVAPDLATMQADSDSLKQILINLVLNARDAMPDGGDLSIAVARQDELLPGGAGPQPCVAIRVRDTGTGMDAATKAKLFEPFFTTKPAGKCVGLGLSTVFGLVQQMGGAIRVESEPGAGATFAVLLPLAEAPAPAKSTPPAPTAAAGRHVLLVDDDANVRRPLALALGNAGFRVTAAANADEALAALRGGGRCDVLLTDVRMPGLSGPQLAAAVECEFGAVPVLFLSGHTDDPLLLGGQLPARRCFLSKPVALDALLTALRTLLVA